MAYATIGVDVTRVDATLQHTLGQKWVNEDTGNVYRYCQAGGAIPADTPCSVAAGWQSVVSGNAGIIDGVSPASAVADNEYFWLQTEGVHADANVNVATTLGMLLALVADANGDFTAVDNDSVTDGLGHVRAKALEADTAGLADVLLYSHL